jgi:ribosomal protein S18 acetylase RimI-like enzyme
LRIRAARADEMVAVAELFRDYAAGLGVDLSYQGFEAELAGLPGAYAPPGGVLLVADAAGAGLVGCVAVRPMAQDGACEMKRLYASPAARGAGVGRALVVAAIGVAEGAGHRVMRLDTLPAMAAAQRLYRELGFQVTPPYYDSPVAGTLFMRKMLAPVGA